MHNSGATRRGMAEVYLAVIARSEATKQSTLAFMLRYGLLRFARNDGKVSVLAMTLGETRYRNTIHAGAWSLAPSSPRSVRSTPALISRGVSAGLSKR